LKEWKIIEGEGYRKTLKYVQAHIEEEIEKSVIPMIEEYPFVEGRCKELREPERISCVQD
jgi:hypothetical protein